MLSIAVCDDEILECCRISGQVKRILQDMGIAHVLYEYHSGGELLRAARRFDIVLLDILMEGLDGMRTAELFREEPCREKAFPGEASCEKKPAGEASAGKIPRPLLIFVTASREYVFDAFEVEAFQYLVKPVGEGRLRRVLGRAVEKLSVSSREFILVSSGRRQIRLLLEDVVYFEIFGRVIHAHGGGGDTEFYEKIGVLEKKLSGKGFFRCHKSYLVNLRHVEGYSRQEALLDNGESVVISKRRYEDFCQAILAFMKKNGGIL